MSQNTEQRFHEKIRKVDLPAIAKNFLNDAQAFRECQEMINASLKRIQLFPNQEGKPCEYEPLSSAEFRKVKLFSVKSPVRGQRPDLRIIYRYNLLEDAVEILSIGFRMKERPRPPEDPYNKAASREFTFE